MKVRDAAAGIGKLEPLERVRGDRQFLVKCPSGHVVGSTKLSRKHSSDEIGAILQAKICRQLGVSMAFWRELVGCTKDRTAYLEARGHETCC